MSPSSKSLRAPQPSEAAREDRRWLQVQDRDPSADGSFVFGVTSTGVFCRPSCPSRRPRHDRVRFFDTPALALAAGFRACLRCRPADPGARPSTLAIARVAAYLEAHAEDTVSLKALSTLARLSPWHLQRQFTRALGLSPREYQAACRADRFRRDLRAGHEVTHAIYEAGYGSPSRIYEAPPTGRGLSPAAYRRGGAGLRIGYTIVPTSLGQLLVAATEKGICSVKLGDAAVELEADLRQEFRAADLARDAVVPRPWVQVLVGRLEGSPGELDLPLDVRGTAFQWRVWRALQRIPSGETRSYSEVAESIDHPSAVRAVARACATNPVCLVVPCHRVVGKDGSLTGYRWGTDRKRRLLELERESHGTGSGRRG